MAKVLKQFIIKRNTNEHENLGLVFVPQYLKFLPTQNQLEETIRLDRFIDETTRNGMFKHKNVTVNFINYGRTQIVLHANVDNKEQYTLVVNQPAVPYGTSRKEFDNLNQLNAVDSQLVIKPITYVTNQKQEMYITPYYQQARCIGVNTTSWGTWVPEPNYHFRDFTMQEQTIINSLMVASLVKLYNQERQTGIAKCRLDGGDFMLLKGYENEKLNYQNMQQYLKLIAAREFVHMDFESYINRLKLEFSSNQLKENDLIIVGRNLRQTLTMEEIDTGIKLGLDLRSQEKSKIMQSTERSL